MRRLTAITGFTLAALLPAQAWPCGGGFGTELELDPSQKIVVSHRDGAETYIFSPHFCGSAVEFGLILPLPGQLTENPVLADAQLFAELDDGVAQDGSRAESTADIYK